MIIRISSFSAAPFGQIPTLEVDGKLFAQSKTIGRLVAKQLSMFLFSFAKNKYYFITAIVMSSISIKSNKFKVRNVLP